MPNSDILKRLVLKGTLLAIPFLLYFGTVILIDPFSFFGYSAIATPELKEEYASKINSPLYLLLRYNEKPAPNILLGDSRMGLIRAETAEKISGKEFFNLSFGASTLPEVMSACRLATARRTPESLYVGISLELYNQYNSRNRVSGVEALIRNPLLYLSNLNVLESTFLIIKAMITNDHHSIEKPAMSRSQFWEYQLQHTGARYFARYAYPQAWYTDLKTLSEQCRSNQTRLVLVILPTHVALQELIPLYHLSGAKSRFLSDLRSLAEVYNFNIRSSLTMDSTHFDDPFHLKKELVDSIASILFTRPVDGEIPNHEWVQYTNPK